MFTSGTLKRLFVFFFFFCSFLLPYFGMCLCRTNVVQKLILFQWTLNSFLCCSQHTTWTNNTYNTWVVVVNSLLYLSSYQSIAIIFTKNIYLATAGAHTTTTNSDTTYLSILLCSHLRLLLQLVYLCVCLNVFEDTHTYRGIESYIL